MSFHPREWDMVLVYPWSHEDIMKKLSPENTVVCVAGGDQLTELRRKFELNCGRFVVYGANTPDIKKTLQKRHPNKRILLLSHGVDTEKFKPDPIPHDEFTVLWVGAVDREIKRFYLAKSMCAELGVKLKVAGRGDDSIFLTHDEMPAFYNSGDVLFITSNYEAHPLVAYEAMSCGIPIVAGNVGDLWETIENGKNGFIFDPCDQARGFRSALKALRDNEELRKSMGRLARTSILQKWKWSFIANQYRALGNVSQVRTDPPRITVVTAVKNRVNDIEQCVDSVISEDYPNLEYIIVDGASTDGTTEILREYEKKHPFITVISEPDKTQGEARNKGLAIATGDYVTFQDSDDAMLKGKLGILSEFLTNNDKYFAVFGNTIFRNPDGEITTDNVKSIPEEINFETLSKNNYIGSGAIMLRNTPEVRFDPDKRFGEDYSLWMKIVMKYPVAHLDFGAYLWTSGSPDGIGKNIPWKKAVDTDLENKANSIRHYRASPYSAELRVAVFCDAFGLHPYGGPAVYGYNICEMLYRSRVSFVMFYGPNQENPPHPDYFRREENLRPRPRVVDVSEFNVFYVMNSPQAIRDLNAQGVKPIIGSNHITNSAADHCLNYLTEAQRIQREQQVEGERAFHQTHLGRMWFAQSKFQMGEYKRVGMNLQDPPVYLAPNPTDTELFKRRTDFGDAVIWSGKNNWAKGLPFLTEVARRVDAPFTVLWGGEGENFPALPPNCSMRRGGTLFSVPPILSEGRVFLSTSVTENQPCAALEAMAMGLPVVGFRTSGMPEVIKDGLNGFLVELGDAKAMAEKVNLLLSDEALWLKMSETAKNFVLNSFSYNRTLEIYLGYFRMYAGV
jgi:glycosyltransferase involved in cell wall biosynthesis